MKVLDLLHEGDVVNFPGRNQRPEVDTTGFVPEIKPAPTQLTNVPKLSPERLEAAKQWRAAHPQQSYFDLSSVSDEEFVEQVGSYAEWLEGLENSIDYELNPQITPAGVVQSWSKVISDDEGGSSVEDDDVVAEFDLVTNQGWFMNVPEDYE